MLEASLSGLALDVQVNPTSLFVSIGSRYPRRLLFCKRYGTAELIWQNVNWQADPNDDEDWKQALHGLPLLISRS
jgi:hypothetical protein